MPQGYLVQLGDTTLDAADGIIDPLTTFLIQADLGAGEWVWSGTFGGSTFTNEIEPGQYYLGTDGNVYFVPDFGPVDTITSASVETAPAPTFDSSDGIVGGTGGDDVINNIFVDDDGDTIGAPNDEVSSGDGDDSINSGNGSDTVTAGGGNDTVGSGGGADIVYGDSNGATSVSEELNWDQLDANGTDLSGGFTLNTGEMDVTVSFTDDGNNNPTFTVDSATTNYVGGGEPFDTTSSLFLFGDGDADTSTTTIDFAAHSASVMSDEVQNVSFRLNDVDFSSGSHRDILTVNAFDADGAAVAVTITPGGGQTVVGNTITSDDTGTSAADLAGSVLIEVAGPVQSIEIVYENGFGSTQGVNVTDVHFETIVPADGDDSINGNGGADTIYGEGGNDSIDGGGGSDDVYGGDGNDTIEGGGTGGADDSLVGGAGDDLITDEGGTGSTDTLEGGSGDDTLDGGLGDDTIDGGEGDDSLLGSGGDDVLTGDQDLLTNGGLEAGVAIGGFSGSTPIAGWSTDASDQFEVWGDGFLGVSAQEGDNFLELDNESPELDNIYQDVQTTAGESYTISFAGLQRDADSDDIEVYWNGVLVGTATPTSNTDWETFTFTVTGTGGTDRLEFREAAGQDDGTGPLLDDISLISAGNDTIDGGDGADTVDAGAGDDEITVDQGDSVSGGSGDDHFTLVDLDTTGTGNATITIVGGEEDETNGDTLQLTPDVTLADITFTNTDDSNGGLSGNFTMADGTLVNFSEIENIICFTPGTRILTRNGERRIETLKPGDMVLTRDNGARPIRWIGRRTVPGRGKLAPIKLSSGSVCESRSDLLVSPQHRVLFTGYRAELLFGESEVLVAAKHLLNGKDVLIQEQPAVTYIHLMFDRHEIIYANGYATESFYAGDQALAAIDAPAREELFRIFPQLRSSTGQHLQTARACLKSSEARLIYDFDQRKAA